jgi:hypothetical protein
VQAIRNRSGIAFPADSDVSCALHSTSHLDPCERGVSARVSGQDCDEADRDEGISNVGIYQAETKGLRANKLLDLLHATTIPVTRGGLHTEQVS